MKTIVAYPIPLLVLGLLGFLLPGIDPYLLLVLAVAGAGLPALVGSVIIAMVGWCAEGLGMQPFGVMIGPLLVLYGAMCWTRDQFFVQAGVMQLPWLVASSLAYSVGMWWLQHGDWGQWFPELFMSLWNAVIGWLAAALLLWWRAWIIRPRHRRRMRLAT